jgi:hypothetical protein
MKPISIEGLASDPDLLSPKPCKLRGWPKTNRIRRNAWKRQERRCRNCRQTGRNTRRCTDLPVSKNGRGERTRYWQAINEEKGNGSDVIMVDTGS